MDDLKKRNPRLVSAIAEIEMLRDFERLQTDSIDPSKTKADDLKIIREFPGGWLTISRRRGVKDIQLDPPFSDLDPPEIDPCKTEICDEEVAASIKQSLDEYSRSERWLQNEKQRKTYMAHLMGTTSGIFEFRNGNRFEIPPPGPGWEMSGNKKDFWPHVFVDEVFEDRFEDAYETEYRVCHEAGLIMLAEYKARVKEEIVRLIEYTSWYWRGEK